MGFYKSHFTHEIYKREKAGNKVKSLIQTQQEQAIGLLSPSAGWYSAYLMSTHRVSHLFVCTSSSRADEP